MKRHLAFLILLVLIFPGSSWAGVTRGIFGIPSIKKLHPSTYISQLKQAEINAVFVPADGETIKWFKEHGFGVYIAINAFGGKGAWKRYPDSVPVKADGQLLGSEPDYKGHGGVCPTHPAWRGERLKHVKHIIKQFGGQGGIDGIWLDFIRYPGLWEVKEPRIPDTCYCQRCLRKFQEDSRVKLPAESEEKKAALWIKKHCPYEWMKWKKEQILSFVIDVRETLGPLKLGLFLVPWTKGEKQNAISYRLAQDAFQLSREADVISPMLYHKMCGKPPPWVGHMIRYYKEGAGCEVWPIVQSMDCNAVEFGQTLKYAGQADADGLLVFSWNGMKRDLWASVQQFQPLVNLIPNPEFEIPKGGKRPKTWKTGRSKYKGCTRSAFYVRPSGEFKLRDGGSGPSPVSRCIGITGSRDRAGEWQCPLPDCEPGEEYVFTGRLYRDKWENGIYPEISLWGQEFYLNNHWLARTFQPIRLYVTCPERPYEHTFRFLNHNPGKTFWLTQPHLALNHHFREPSKHEESNRSSFYKKFFPIGVFGAGMGNLDEIKKLSINTVLIGGSGEGLKKTVLKCHQLGLKYVLAVPRDPERLPVFLNNIAEYVIPNDVAFYINDEPGIHSFPINRANDINRLIKERFPQASTCMAVVRAQVCRDYLKASDFFMLDQYPVPYMPMTWLSDSMDQAGNDAGRDRLASIIQAFGGKKWADWGWPRSPTWQEMDCLAFLSIVHGSRGIFFFTFKEIGKTEEGRQRLRRVVERLNKVYPWLMEKNLEKRVNIEMVSASRVDPGGRQAIHCCLKKKKDKALLIAVNTIGTYVEAVIRFGDSEAAPDEIIGTTFHRAGKVREIFSGLCYPVGRDGLRAKFGPYETKVFVSEAAGK